MDRILCFNGVGKTVEHYVDKGMKLMVRGRIHYTRWTDSENIERYDVEIIADEVTFPNVLITGHQAFFTAEALAEIARTTIENLSSFEDKGVPANPVAIST